MKRLLSLVLVALLTVVFVFQMRRLLERAPEGGSVVSWVLAFVIVGGLMVLVAWVLRAAARATGVSR
jgi:hypothetical protein